MKDYHDLSLELYALWLAFVFETLRKKSISSFESDPTHCFSTRGYSWNAMLRFIDIKLKLISDIKK